MKTPIVDQMIKNLEWQTTKSQWTTQRNIDLLAELKALKLALTIPVSSLQFKKIEKPTFEEFKQEFFICIENEYRYKKTGEFWSEDQITDRYKNMYG